MTNSNREQKGKEFVVKTKSKKKHGKDLDTTMVVADKFHREFQSLKFHKAALRPLSGWYNQSAKCHGKDIAVQAAMTVSHRKLRTTLPQESCV